MLKIVVPIYLPKSPRIRYISSTKIKEKTLH
jgi:hypothetical protein